MHPTILSGDVTPSSLGLIPPPPPLHIPSSLNESKDNDLLNTTTDINDDGSASDSSISGNNELIRDDGPIPLTCDRGSNNKKIFFMKIKINIIYLCRMLQ
jgi:hypothetical protein